MEDDMRHKNSADLQLWLREAKVLHKQAQSESLTRSLPVLRRLLNAEVLTNISLVELKNTTKMIQRKHLLQMLAVENGSHCWTDFKQQIESAADGAIRPNSLELREAGYPVLWFSSGDEASAYTEHHGGKIVKLGSQAAVVPPRWEC
jgi:hypothetical protein